MLSVVQHVEQSIMAKRLLRRGQALLVAISGGLDSMVLLEVLRRLAPLRRWTLTVAHFNHQLRGRSSDADEALVRRTAQRFGLRCVVERGAVKPFAKAQKCSIEMAARHLRHAFLVRVAREQSLSTVALAHHSDDQVELFFLRLLRGAGGLGLAGMKWASPSPADPEITLIRPLLDQSRESLARFAQEEGVKFREDMTNASLDVLRNRVRHELLPLLVGKYQPALNRIILRQMEILSADADFLNHAVRDWLARKSPAAFQRLPVALQRAVIQAQLVERGIPFEFDLIEQLRASPGKAVMVRSGLTLSRDERGRVQCREVQPFAFEDGEVELDLAERGSNEAFAGLKLRWEIQSRGAPSKPRFSAGAEWFDADKVGSPVCLRHWREGDRFQPIGLSHSAKLQDLFTNLKVPRSIRHRLVVATTRAGDIWWVEGLRIAEPFKLTRETKRFLKWTWNREAESRLASGERTPPSR